MVYPLEITWRSSCLDYKNWTRVKKFGYGKHSSLLPKSVDYAKKKFCNICPRCKKLKEKFEQKVRNKDVVRKMFDKFLTTDRQTFLVELLYRAVNGNIFKLTF